MMRILSALALPFLLSSLVNGNPAPKSVKPVSAEDKEAVDTVFNGQTVPPMQRLDGAKVRQEIANGYWLLEAFSPYCHHCQALAPKLQTIYEYYYTSDPVPASTEPIDAKSSFNSFSRYYNFKFAKLDCVAFMDACVDLGTNQFPTMFFMKDGVEVKRITGDKDMKKLSEFIEECLESIRPGSRPSGGPVLPEAGANATEAFAGDKSGAAGDATLPVPNTPQNQLSILRATTGTPNPNGSSVALDPETFQSLVKDTLDPWFIKFYAPWCHHCKAMAPAWESMAREMKGRLNVGEVNCEVHRKLCSQNKVKAFPTIYVFRGTEKVEYQGLRGVGDFVDYAHQCESVVGEVPDVTLAEFKKMEEKEEVIFVYFYDHATTSEDFMAMERLPLQILGHAKLVKTKDPEMNARFKIYNWPRLAVSREGVTSEYQGMMPKEMRNIRALSFWIHGHWLPLVAELKSANSHDIMQNKITVLAVLDRTQKSEFESALKEMKVAAIEWMDKTQKEFVSDREGLRREKQLKIEEAERQKDAKALQEAKLAKIDTSGIEKQQVVFAWVDINFWQRWIKLTYNIEKSDGPRVIISDLRMHQYWDVTSSKTPILPHRTSILETLPKVTGAKPQIPSKRTNAIFSYGLFWMRTSITEHPLWVLMLSMGSFGAWYYVRRNRRAGPAYHRHRRAVSWDVSVPLGFPGGGAKGD